MIPVRTYGCHFAWLESIPIGDDTGHYVTSHLHRPSSAKTLIGSPFAFVQPVAAATTAFSPLAARAYGVRDTFLWRLTVSPKAEIIWPEYELSSGMASLSLAGSPLSEPIETMSL